MFLLGTCIKTDSVTLVTDVEFGSGTNWQVRVCRPLQGSDQVIFPLAHKQGLDDMTDRLGLKASCPMWKLEIYREACRAASQFPRAERRHITACATCSVTFSSACTYQRQRASSEKSSLHLIRPSAFLASASLLACITSTAPGAADQRHHLSLWGTQLLSGFC